MKNTFNFTLGSVNVNIDGTPVNIENVNIAVDSEMSVAEMTQAFGMIKSVINEIKNMMEPSPSITPVEISTSPTGVKTIKKEPEKVDHQTLNDIWNDIKDLTKYFNEKETSRIRWTKKSEDDSKCLEEVEFKFETNYISMFVKTNVGGFWCHLYEYGTKSYCAVHNNVAKDIITSISDEIVSMIAMSFLIKVNANK